MAARKSLAAFSFDAWLAILNLLVLIDVGAVLMIGNMRLYHPRRYDGGNSVIDWNISAGKCLLLVAKKLKLHD